jgi:HSP20 family protein
MVDQIRDLIGSYGEPDSSSVATSTWAPAVDIHEDQHQYTIEADLPGVKKENIEVYMDKGCLSIKGERLEEKKIEKGNFTRNERMQGTFCRKFMLPDTANTDNINASFADGVLKLLIPKVEAAKPKRININSNSTQNTTVGNMERSNKVA